MADLHIADERLAELADGLTPENFEGSHLSACLRCHDELDAYRSVISEARDHRAVGGSTAPLTNWVTLSSSLQSEGLIATSPAVAGVLPLHDRQHDRRNRRVTPVWAWRAAAATLLVAGGIAGGRLSAGASLMPGLGGGVAEPARRIASILADSAPEPVSSNEAMAILSRAERDYRMATAFLASSASPEIGVDSPEVYQRRLAVMDEVASLTRAALVKSPHDQVLNQYYLASLGAREATLRSLAIALPHDSQLSRF